MMQKQPEWRNWYQLERWRRKRRFQLMEEPLCVMCAERGIAAPATIADHIEPHHGDWNDFWLGKLQSLCKNCHETRKRDIERRGYVTDIGSDGWPIDPKHPANMVRH